MLRAGDIILHCRWRQLRVLWTSLSFCSRRELIHVSKVENMALHCTAPLRSATPGLRPLRPNSPTPPFPLSSTHHHPHKCEPRSELCGQPSHTPTSMSPLAQMVYACKFVLSAHLTAQLEQPGALHHLVLQSLCLHTGMSVITVIFQEPLLCTDLGGYRRQWAGQLEVRRMIRLHPRWYSAGEIE